MRPRLKTKMRAVKGHLFEQRVICSDETKSR
jgi:hypothetical protein